jgi:hypothetical protein
MMEYLKRVKITILAVVLLSCVLCGAMTAGVKPALAALSPLAEEICSVTWGAEPQPTGVTLRVEIECPWLMRLRLINRLHLNPIDRKW